MVEPKLKIFDNFQRSVPYFTVTHNSWVSKASSGFKMANFKAYFHAMAVGTSNNCAINIKFMTITLQIEANGKFGKEKIKKTVIVQGSP